VIAIGLFLFAGFVYFVSRQDPVNGQQVKSISSMDAIWVLGSVVLCVIQPFGLSSIAYVSIAVVALIVGLFGVQQYKNVRYRML
jgi:hypothetical protein